MKFETVSFVCTHVGKVRQNNEDNFFLNGLSYDSTSGKKGFVRRRESAAPVQLYAVFDGMGGQEAGEEASALGASLMNKLLLDLNEGEDVRSAVDRYTALVNDAVVSLARQAGSTMVLLCIKEGVASVAWLGDSRAYLLRNGALYRLTENHTQARHMAKLGFQSSDPHARNLLTRHLGMDAPGLVVTPAYASDLALKKHDVFLLCSDGLTNHVEEEKIAEILDSAQFPERELANAALGAGGADNVTALVVDVTKLARPVSSLFAPKKSTSVPM